WRMATPALRTALAASEEPARHSALNGGSVIVGRLSAKYADREVRSRKRAPFVQATEGRGPGRKFFTSVRDSREHARYVQFSGSIARIIVECHDDRSRARTCVTGS